MKRILILLVLVSGSAQAHDEGGESKASVGPDKGILAVDAEQGFVLRSSAAKNFSITTTALGSGPTWSIPAAALVYSGLETQVFRQREGHWKSIEVELVRKKAGTVDIRSADLRAGDIVAVEGTGFLKIIEQSVD